MAKVKWSGVFPALNTITDEQLEFDPKGMQAEIEANIKWGADGLCVSIIAGEFYKFSEEERRRIFEVTIDTADGRLPILAGVSHSGTECAIKLARFAEDVGADGVVVMAPYFNHSPNRAIIQNHIASVCKATSIPVMLQDAEDATGIHICPTVYLDLIEEHSNLVSIKLEGPGTIDKLRDINRLIPGRVSVFGGMAARLILREVENGTDGTIPSACLTDLIKDIWYNAKSGTKKKAMDSYTRYKPWVDMFHASGGATAEMEKETLRLRGVVNTTTSRGPRLPLGEDAKKILEKIIEQMNLI